MPKTLRQLIPALALLLLLLISFLLLVLTDTALGIWQKLQDFSPIVWSIYLAALLLGISLSAWLVYRIFRPRIKAAPAAERPKVTRDQLASDLELAETRGADVRPAQNELRQLAQRNQEDALYVAFFGRVSSGKSSLIQQLLPDATITRSVLAGTTSRAEHYQWQSANGTRLILIDTPGINDGDCVLDPLASDEALRAHIVVFVCDGDLSAGEHAYLKALLESNKPVVLAFNKSDRYDIGQLHLIREKLQSEYGNELSLVSVNAAGGKRVLQLESDGTEKESWTKVPARMEELVNQIQAAGAAQQANYRQLLETALLNRAGEKLEQATRERRNSLAEKEVTAFSKKAVLGALAALTPGSDLVIQAVLATQLIKRLAKIYEVPIKSVEIEDFVRMAGSKVRTHSSIALAVAGNGLKAFPGVGTVAGGLVHAVAYGMIFSGLGKAACKTLEGRRSFPVQQTAALFEQELTSDSPGSLEVISKMAIAEFGRHTSKPQSHRAKSKDSTA